MKLKRKCTESRSDEETSDAVLSEWDKTSDSLKDGVPFLFNKYLLSDVSFLVGVNDPGVRIPAHRIVLCIRSTVFRKMFCGKMAMKENEIRLPDIEPDAFLCFLRYLYTDEVKIDGDTVTSVLYTAKKYDVRFLVKECLKLLWRNISRDNALVLFTQARLFDEPQLADTCLKIIDHSLRHLLVSNAFLELDQKSLCEILQHDSLQIREVDLFKAVVRWSEAECNRRSIQITPENQRLVIGQALNFIRFPLMTAEEFSTIVTSTEILTLEDVAIFDNYTPNSFRALFDDHSDLHTICRFREAKQRKVCRKNEGILHEVEFFVDQHIRLVGLGLYSSVREVLYDVNITVKDVKGRTQSAHEKRVVPPVSETTFQIFFEPVVILPGTRYIIGVQMRNYADLKPYREYTGYNSFLRLEKTVDKETGKKVVFNFGPAGISRRIDVVSGQIPQFIFSA